MTVEKTKYYGLRCCGKEGLWGHNIICTGLSDEKLPKRTSEGWPKDIWVCKIIELEKNNICENIHIIQGFAGMAQLQSQRIKVWIATSYTVNVGCLGRLGSGKAQQVK